MNDGHGDKDNLKEKAPISDSSILMEQISDDQAKPFLQHTPQPDFDYRDDTSVALVNNLRSHNFVLPLSKPRVIGLTDYPFGTSCRLLQMDRRDCGGGMEILMWWRILMGILITLPFWIPEQLRILTLVYNRGTCQNCHITVTHGKGLEVMKKFGNVLTV
ncbi:hypothetical protein ACH5RR_021609 [Cinchona calisaya]|uniref:Uncharacterized protein n=1 Tax=Cinchona calisaya TaxID=153742 RepID=A0ABD2ZHT8_9GENT